jgi:acetyl esterase/lipase
MPRPYTPTRSGPHVPPGPGCNACRSPTAHATTSAPEITKLAGLPPLLVQAGTGDTVVDEARALAERAGEHHVDVTLQLYPADTHVFHVFWPFLAEAGQALAAAGVFTRRGRDHRLGRTGCDPGLSDGSWRSWRVRWHRGWDKG